MTHDASLVQEPSPATSTWRARALMVATLVGAFVAFACLLPGESPALPPAATVTHGPRDVPRIALTFDDNYAPHLAIPAMKALRSLQCPATIFVTGMYVNGYYDIDQELADGVAAGLFEVGDHSSTHPFLNKIPWDDMMREIGAGTAAFTALTGARAVPLLRPPYGATSPTVAEAAGAKGMRYVVLWDVGSDDWKGLSAETIRDDVLRNARNGSIVLLHLAAAHTYEAIPGIVLALRARGFELVTVSELLKDGRRFLDVGSSTPGANAILRLVDGGYMSGYSESYFGPTDAVTRAQFAKVATLVAGLHTPGVEAAPNPTFVDVPLVRDVNGNAIAYPFDYVEEAAAAGLVAGIETSAGKKFDPGNNISRVQLAQILARMARSLRGYPQTPPSVAVPADVPAYAAADVSLTVSLGLMTGYSSARFDPWAPAQRSHVAQVMSRFLDLPQYELPPTTTTTVPTSTTTTTSIPWPTTTTTTSTTTSSTTSSTTTTTAPGPDSTWPEPPTPPATIPGG